MNNIEALFVALSLVLASAIVIDLLVMAINSSATDWTITVYFNKSGEGMFEVLLLIGILISIFVSIIILSVQES